MKLDARTPDLARIGAAEFLGSALLVACVVGSGIMAERLTHDFALALLCNAIATGTLLAVLIMVLAPVSRAHFNPAVSLAALVRRELAPAHLPVYLGSQFSGAIAGTWLAHAMFGLPILAEGMKVRAGMGQLLGEAVATFGLLLTIYGASARDGRLVGPLVGLYIVAAYWFTSSTSFANPAVTLARALTPTFAGIRPIDVPLFILAQLAGACVAVGASGWLFTVAPVRAVPPSVGDRGAERTSARSAQGGADER